MRLIKFSTFLVKVTHKNNETVSYMNYTDMKCHVQTLPWGHSNLAIFED